MYKKSLLAYWADKGHNATIIPAKMESHFGSSVPFYSWAPKCLRALERGEDIFEPCRRSDRPQNPLTGLRVLEFLNSTPFASIRQIATVTKVQRSAVSDHLKGWGYTVRYLKCVPHHLTPAMMEQQIELSRELLVALRSANYCGWIHFLTGDKSCFWLTINHE
jgi:hypothetical protein